MRAASRHLVVVEAYDGLLEYLTAEPDQRGATRALGLPLRAIAEALGCRITLITWDDWLTYEQSKNAFLGWDATPETRPLRRPGPAPHPLPEAVGGIRIEAVPARDPDHGLPFRSAGCSARVRGLLADSDPLLTLAFCLEQHLLAIHEVERIDAVLVPMWGGLGYLAQMARATGCSSLEQVSFGVLVTDTSARRQRANGEDFWTRPALTRRQMEDLSLALADTVLVYGERGTSIASAGRAASKAEPIAAVRFVPEAVLDDLADAAERARPSEAVELFSHGPLQGASGTLVTLDALALLQARDVRLPSPLRLSGPDMVFAPMAPRDFRSYWTTRGFVRELVDANQLVWLSAPVRSAAALDLRLHPGLFEHLPCVWLDLARGCAIAVADAALQGLVANDAVPPLARITGEPDASALATSIEQLAFARPAAVDQARRQLCRAVLAAHRGPMYAKRFERMVSRLDQWFGGSSSRTALGSVAPLLLDRTRAPASACQADGPRPEPKAIETPSLELTVVVTCHEMGDLLRETIESVWAAHRVPDELILVDDGSYGGPTLRAMADLEIAAARRGRPLRVLRQSNAGLAAARNAGLAAAGGRFISFLDGDDLILPDFYEVALRLLKAEPRLGGVAAWAEVFDEDGPVGFWNPPQPELPLLLVENTVIVPCMVRTAVLRALGGYDSGQRYNYEDWELSVRMLVSGHPIVAIPRYLQRYRVRRDSLLRTMTPAQHQAMRERMLTTHRTTAARFAPEVAMLLEGRLMRAVSANRPGLPGQLRSLPKRLAQRTLRWWRLGAVRRGGA